MKTNFGSMLAAAAIAVTLASLSAAADSRPISAGPAGEAFYTPPSPLPSGARGSVIWSRALEGTMALPSAARNTLVLYRSTDANGRSVPVSGTVSVPPGDPPRGGWPVITWTHGTTGLAPICAPSRDKENGPEHPYIEVIRTLLDGFVKHGYAVVASDYQGLGTPGPHPFLQGVPTGRNAIDMLRAGRAVEQGIGRRYAVMGHSQGGQADLFAASLGPSYAPEFKLVGDVAFAPGSHIADRLKAVMNSPKNELSLPYVLYTLQSYAANHRSIDLKRILTPQAIANLPSLMEGCMSHALTTGYWASAIAKDQFVAKPDIAPFLAVAKRNEPGRLRIAAPTLVIQGTKDVTVFPDATDALVRDLCVNCNVVEYEPIAGEDHNGSMKAGATLAREWIEARFAGRKARNECGKLPRAATR